MPLIPAFLLLDAARMGDNMDTAKQLCIRFDTLIQGKNKDLIIRYGPFLFDIQDNIQFKNWYFEQGWGDSWGVLVYSSEDQKSIVKHLGGLLLSKTPNGRDRYFRFYDPRVLRKYLPGCDKNQLKDFFGSIDYFITEDEDPEFGILFYLQDGKLLHTRITKETALTFSPEPRTKGFSTF
ncbi:MAG: DUF4123 domain-containing protein [Bacteroidetes bacterium]|nr:DUF4123 domain-containing protein [Bacteroidota bacterium]